MDSNIKKLEKVLSDMVKQGLTPDGKILKEKIDKAIAEFNIPETIINHVTTTQKTNE